MSWTDYLPAWLLGSVVALLGLSAFFSGTETAFFSIHKIRLRAMRDESRLAGRLVAKMMASPGPVLTTLLVANMIVNILIGILLGTRVEELFVESVRLPVAAAYGVSVFLCTGVLLVCGEIVPKVFAVHTSERFARVAVFPLTAVMKLLEPVCGGLLWLTNLLFRVTRFHELRAAPFITDEEFRSVLSEGEATGVIEEDERQMIQGILEFTDAKLGEILTPRLEIVALPDDAAIEEALTMLRKHEYSRMPVYKEDLDHIVGVLVAKDMFPCITKGELNRPILPLLHPPHFVPATMTVQQFMKAAQRRRTHLAIVVDEYGGTEGIVTLEDAMEQVVGDIMDEGEKEEIEYEKIEDGVYRVDGGIALDDLGELIGVSLRDEEHETLAGFLMEKISKLPEPGDALEYGGIRFTVESCSGRRVVSVRAQILPKPAAAGDDPS